MIKLLGIWGSFRELRLSFGGCFRQSLGPLCSGICDPVVVKSVKLLVREAVPCQRGFSRSKPAPAFAVCARQGDPRRRATARPKTSRGIRRISRGPQQDLGMLDARSGGLV